MKRILIPLCLVLGSHFAIGQRSYQFNAEDRLFREGKELFSLKNYPGCTDKLEAYKKQSTDLELIQESDYMLVYAAFEQGREDTPDLLKNFLDTYPDTPHRDEVNYLIGCTHFSRGEYEKAVFWFKEANIDLLSLSTQEAYSFRLGYALLQTGERDEARGYFARIREIGTTYRDASTYYLAYIDYAEGRYDQALTEFSRLKDHPEFKEQSLYYITQIYFIRNQYDKVISSGESLLSAYPDSKNNTELYRLIGHSYYQNGDQEEAIRLLSKYVSSTEKPLRGDLYILGVCYFNKGNYNSAVNALKQTVAENDALTQNAYLYLGQSYLKLNEKNNARMAFELAATSTFDKQVQEAAMYNYALTIHETSFTGFGESVTIFEDFLNDFPNSKYADKVNDYLVEVYLTTKNYTAALNSINKIRRPSTKILEAKQNILFQLGTQYFTNTRMEEAIDYFGQAIALGSYDAKARSEAYFWRGESYYRSGNFERAASDYRSYLSSTTQRNTDMYALARYNLGYCYFKEKQYNEALASFREYLPLEKDNKAATLADAYNRIGDCLFYNRQFAAAEENYSRAANLLPESGDYAIFQKGFLMGLQKDYRGKISTMDQLIREFPESQYVDDALFEKGRSYVLLENYNAAATAFDALIRQFPQSSLARQAGLELGLLYYNSNQPQKSIAAYKEVIKNYPNSEEAKTAIQDMKSVYVDLNDVGSYASYVNSLGGSEQFEVNEQDSLTYLAAERLFTRGETEAARKSLVNYLQSFPKGAFVSDANFYLGSVAFAHKEYAEAKKYFTSVLESGNTKYRENALARKAEIEYLTKEYEAALESFKRLQSIAEGKENREAAKLGAMRCAQFLGRQNDALTAANELLKETKLSPEVQTEARYIRAKAYIGLKEESKALADLKELAKDTRTVQGAESKYLLAKVYFDGKELDKAEKELMNFIENGTPHAYWLARGFILLADVYITKGDDFQARQYLTSLQKNYKGSDDIAGMIEERLAKLKK